MGNLIVKDNALIEASHRLGEAEQRLVLLAILKARNVGDMVEQLKDKELIIHADDYIQTFGVDRSVAYKTLKKAVMRLFEAKWGYKYVDDKGLERVRYERFTQSADYGRDDGVVKFVFANAIIPFLVQLERNFTTYEIKQVAELSSGYAMRLYEFLIQKLNRKTGKGWLAISLDDLRFRFGLLPTEYQAMKDFKKRVLDLAVNQINEHTDLTTNYTQKKQGRKIVGFHFDFECKEPSKSQEQDQDEQDDLIPQNEQEQEIVAENNTYADSINATEKHRKNLVRKALREHRQAEKERIARLEAERQAELARKKQEAERAEQARKREQAKQAMLEAENQAFIAYFESLTAEEQEQILDDVQKSVLGSMTKGFKQARLNGKAHTMTMYRKFFKDVMGL